jgi:hypothetical protein
MFTTMAFLLYRLASFSILFIQEAQPSDFDDLGTLILGGALVAIGVGVAVSFIRAKMQSRERQDTQFISIKPSDKKDL